jgi:Tfp pilus assembly protein PilF
MEDYMLKKVLLVVFSSLLLSLFFSGCVAQEQMSETKPVISSEVKKDNSYEVNKKMSFAQEYYKNKNYTEAIPLYKDVIENLDPDNKTAYKFLAYSYLKYEDKSFVDSALVVFHTAAQKYSDKSFPYTGLGYIFYTLGETDSAAFYYDKAVKIDPKDKKSIQLLSTIHYNHKDYAQAKTYLEQYLTLDKDNLDIWKMLKTLYDMDGNEDKLFEAYSNLHRLDPSEPEYLLELGQAYAKMNNFPKATEILNKYIANNPDDYKGFRYLGLIYMIEENYTEASKNLQKAVEIAPDNSNLHCELATIGIQSGKLSSARKCLRNAKKVEEVTARVYIIEGNIITKEAYNMLPPDGTLDYCTKLKYEIAYNTYKKAAGDERWGETAKRLMNGIKDYRPTSEEKSAWKFLGKSCR